MYLSGSLVQLQQWISHLIGRSACSCRTNVGYSVRTKQPPRQLLLDVGYHNKLFTATYVTLAIQRLKVMIKDDK